jgi:hypothetical protein
MSNISIFKSPNAVAVTSPRELSPLAKSLANSSTYRRIQANNTGTFKRLVNGEQIGNAVRGEINVIVVNALPSVSRTFYKSKFDPNKEAMLPDCWSNLGDVPEAASPNKQSNACASCKQNVKGSGDNGSRACRFQRRIAVLLADDSSGDVYQFNVPAKSLFGKGAGNSHPFESYTKFLAANNESIDNVVTTISFDGNADTMELKFTPQRLITDEEYALVRAAQMRPETKSYTTLTVAQVDRVSKAPATAAVEPEETEVIEATPAPTKRGRKPAPAVKNNGNLADEVSAWGEDD